MEKLLELLNEYEPYIQSDGTHTDNFWWYVSQGHSAVFPKEVGIERIISKSYGFIKWLVENDKIDFGKCGLDIKKYLSYNKRYDKGIVMAENYDNDTFEVREFYSPYEQLLMLLSISETPIDNLISYLR